jgi:hypothetical protein
MLFLYNNLTDVYRELYRKAYENMDEYLGSETEDTTVFEIMFVISLNDIFEQAKRRTAMRGKYAKDEQGGPLLEKFAMTDDEQDFFNEILPRGSSEVFSKLSAYAKDVVNAHRVNAIFGAKTVTGNVTSVNDVIITDTSLTLTENALKGYRLVITTEGDLKDMERDIVSNTSNTITIDMPFEDDITDLSYAVYNPNEKYCIYSVKITLSWDINQLQAAEASITESLVLYIIKEWYLINRLMDDYGIEESRYQQQLQGIRDALMHRTTFVRRPADLFG